MGPTHRHKMRPNGRLTNGTPTSASILEVNCRRLDVSLHESVWGGGSISLRIVDGAVRERVVVDVAAAGGEEEEEEEGKRRRRRRGWLLQAVAVAREQRSRFYIFRRPLNHLNLFLRVHLFKRKVIVLMEEEGDH
uniref:Uncharacterized protein n=1 Tax=Oryza punctata TaxID=4537 RepID=A0A0E0MAB3_ORYPU